MLAVVVLDQATTAFYRKDIRVLAFLGCVCTNFCSVVLFGHREFRGAKREDMFEHETKKGDNIKSKYVCNVILNMKGKEHYGFY